ncbi:hypothetical protein [Hyphomicrobium sp. DY-1]|jgi:hypothetical protein|uniref:hypothetical protein n=1 Tax=Hyphomicrobium sp. DY-1 TaxID=3075650 RepID=UPI0039C09E37
MDQHIRFHGYCSKTRQPFLIVATLREGTLTFKGAAKIEPGGAFGQGRPPLPSQPITRIDSSSFTCPCCGTNAKPPTSWATWFCHTCETHHCMGTDNGLCHGACGNCLHDPASFVPATTVAVKPADARDF